MISESLVKLEQPSPFSSDASAVVRNRLRSIACAWPIAFDVTTLIQKLSNLAHLWTCTIAMTDDIAALLPWLDWAYARVRAAHQSA